VCEKCAEIDQKIARYKALSARLIDRPRLERIEALMADLLALKEEFHPPLKK
jgi:hypothetical protein